MILFYYLVSNKDIFKDYNIFSYSRDSGNGIGSGYDIRNRTNYWKNGNGSRDGYSSDSYAFKKND